MSTKRIAIIVAAAAAVAFILWFLQPDASQPRGTSGGGAASEPQQDHFQLARNQLQRLDEFDPRAGMVQTAYQLNRWLADAAEDVSWSRDPMIDDLPAPLREMLPLQTLDKREFRTDEVRYLQQASWGRSISQWILRQNQPTRFDAWLEQLEQSRGEPHAYDVGVAIRLFDWTIRNVQLETLQPYPSEPEEGSDSPAIAPLAMAVPGPGYTSFPWQVMLFGRGDAWQRARVFILLCRQQQIDVVMLALADGDRPQPWLPAAMIDDQLYLFDTHLGLSIPAAGGQGIATLRDVQADKSLLSDLSVGSDYPYQAAKADLDQLVGLIDASYEALTYRMRAVQQRASQGEPLFLAVDPTQLAQRLRKNSQIDRVQLWQVPFETWIYRTAMERRADQDPAIAQQLMFEHWICDEQHPLVQGRVRYFRGDFEKTDDDPGAKSFYIQAIVPDAMISQIETSPEIQQELGIARRRENDQQWQLALQFYRATIVSIKQTAAYWLGITHYDTQRYETAVPWLKKRTLESGEDNPWKAGARYNLSRTYEQLGDLEAARQLLLLDESPQKHGNLLRARYLRRLLENAPASNGQM
jgi:tetratricopeptide (TPR) repeat protein